MSGADPLLELKDVSISYFTRAGEIPAVTGVSLSLPPEGSLGLVGESGCGKSTLAMAILRHFSGRGRLVGGAIHFDGRDIAELSPEELRQLRGGEIGIVYQEAMSALNPSLRVGEQLAEVAVSHNEASWSAAHRRSVEILNAVKFPDPDRIMRAYPHQLSGGQQQRVVIAMALLPRPKLLLLDEPTTSLDVTVEAGIIDFIGTLRKDFGTALLFISHNLGLVAQVCERVAVMYSGELAEEGAVREVFAAPRHPYTRGLIRCMPQPHVDRAHTKLRPIPGQMNPPGERPAGCVFGPRCAHFERHRCGHDPIALVETTNGSIRRVRCVRWREIGSEAPADPIPDRPERTEEMALIVADLDKFYQIEEPGLLRRLAGARRQQIKANQNLNFRIRRGQTVAIVGESGCGKSTFAKVLMGLERATAGAIRFGEVDLARLPVERRPREVLRALQMVFQNPDETLNPSFTVGGQIARAVRRLGAARGRGRISARVRELLELTRLPADFAARWPRQLSGGQKQRVGIARAFAGSPALVVADEPVSALDVSVQAAITELLLDIQRSQGTTLVIISHDLGFVRYIADRVVVMYLGQIMETGSVEQLFAPPYHPYTEALFSAAPIADPSVRRSRIVLSGELPSAVDPPRGCPFHTRCPRKLGSICETEAPPLWRGANGHRIHCHIPLDELSRIAPVFQPNSRE
ncbi:MAG TPA: ABC transporter ATP-binding protein [Stellaceae bacterium]|nr:ABC transporter ATP-binding protein [Stellaceae bacterium]